MTIDHTNLTEAFDNAFLGGFMLHLANFTYYAFGEPFDHQLRNKETAWKSEIRLSEGVYLNIHQAIQIVLRTLTIICSAM